MSLFKDLLDKDTCTICGQEVSAVGGGHYVTINTTPTSVDGGEATFVTEFHCITCDPLNIKQEVEEVKDPFSLS